MSYGRAAIRTHRHFVAGLAVPADRRLDGTLGPVRHAPDEGQIGPLQYPGTAMIGELLLILDRYFAADKNLDASQEQDTGSAT